ncbi:hypothetical protein ACVWZA_002685 [Sphingomonas sp. UYAg733]
MQLIGLARHSSLLHGLRQGIEAPRFTDPALGFYWPVGVLFATICFAIGYPGRLNQDSLYSVITMTSPGELGNWHSATLGWLWSLPGPLLGQPAGGLLIQSILFGLFAGFLPRTLPTMRGRLTLALELLFRLTLAGSFGYLGKDIVTVATLLIAVQLIRYGLHVRLGYAHYIALALLVLFMLLIKAPNFLTFVLCIAMLLPFAVRSPKIYGAVVAVALLMGLLAVPLNRVVDRALFHAKDMHPDKQLVIFDLAAISLRTGTNAFAKVPGWPAAKLPPIGKCFMPNMWDPFAPWGPCAGYSAAYDPLDGPLTRRWATEIVSHPIAYAQHRLTYAGYLLRSQDHATWGIAGVAVNDTASPIGALEMSEMMTRLRANRPVQLWQTRPADQPFQWLETGLLRYPKVQSVAMIGSLAILLLCGLRRREGIRLGALLPAGLALGNFGMLVVFGVADPVRYLLPTICLFYVALLALLVPGSDPV